MTIQTEEIGSMNCVCMELFAVLDELLFDVGDGNNEIVESTDSLLSTMQISQPDAEAIYPHLIWWGTFCSPDGNGEKTVYQKLLQKNNQKWEQKNIQVQKVLANWLHLNPGFYYVHATPAARKGVYYLTDVFTGKEKILKIYSGGQFQSVQSGDMLTGLLLPMGNDHYLALSELYLIPQPLTDKVVKEIVPYFERHAVSSKYTNNPQLYPYLVKRALEIINESAGDPHFKNE